MKTNRILTLLVISFFRIYSTYAGIYVDSKAIGRNDGTDWENAFNAIPTDINDDVYISEGLYSITEKITIQEKGRLIGGFSQGGEEYNFFKYQTIIDGALINTRLIDCNGSIEGVILQNANTSDVGAAVNMLGKSQISYSVIRQNEGKITSSGICCTSGSNITVFNCLFYNNKITNPSPLLAHGGTAILVQNNGVANVFNSTLIGDFGLSESAGIIHGVNSSGSVVNLYNSIVYYSLSDNKGTAVSRGKFNLFNSFINSKYSTANVDAVKSIIEGNPYLNEDYTLNKLSPCVNSGNNSYLSNFQYTVDLNGDSRIQNDVIDMGAFESAFATNSGDDNLLPVIPPTPVLAKREDPLREMQIERRIYISDYPGNTDYEKITAAIRDIPKNNLVPTEIIFEGRDYIFDNDQEYENKAVLFLNEINNVLINGNGANIYFSGKNFRDQIMFVSSSECQNLIIRGFNIDYLHLPFTQGVIVEKRADGFVVETDLGYRPFDDPFFSDSDNAETTGKLWFFLKDKNVPGRQKDNALNVYNGAVFTRMDHESGRRFFCNKIIGAIAVGDRIVKPGFGGTTGMFTSRGGNQITYQDINIYSSQVATCWSQGTENLNLLNYQVGIKPGTDRIQATSRDGMIVSKIKNGPWIENCKFEATGDDGVNFHVKRYAVKQQTTDQILLNTTEASIGDTLIFVDNTQGYMVALGTVKNIIAGPDNSSRFYEFDQNMPVFKKDFTCYNVYNLNDCCRNFYITNTSFRFTRRYGLWLCSQSGIVENCYFEGNSWSAIATMEDYKIPQGPVASFITIRNNEFSDNSLQLSDKDQTYNSAIRLIGPKVIDNNTLIENTSKESLYGIRIENNNFSKWETRNRAAITLKNASSSIITGNTFYCREMGKNALVLDYNAENTRISNNVYVEEQTNNLINNELNQKPIYIYPNPVKDFLFISDDTDSLVVTDFLGKSWSVNRNSLGIEVAGLLPGIYFIRIKSQNFQFIKI
ncbi:MAG: T9SS type A sorting domain-containing protein [Bacteroidales bacterium]